MTPRQVDRAKTLRDALSDLPRMYKNVGRKKDGREGLAFQVHLPEANYVGGPSVDPKTARIILRATEKIIRTELNSLGVKLPRARKRRAR